MIAYDFDGVICPDINLPWADKGFDFSGLFDLRDKLPPIFYPTGKFMVITGRPIIDKEKTQSWCKKYNIHPMEIHYNLGDPNHIDEVAIHKANTLNKLENVKMFVESDPKQVETIKQMTTKSVVHFAEFISRGLHENLFRLHNV